MKKNDFISLCFISFVVGFLLSCFMNSRKQSSYEGFDNRVYDGTWGGGPTSSGGDFGKINKGLGGLKFSATVSGVDMVKDIRIVDGIDGLGLSCGIIPTPWGPPSCPMLHSALEGGGLVYDNNLLWGTDGIDLKGGKQTIHIGGGNLQVTPTKINDTSFRLTMDINDINKDGFEGGMKGIIINFS